MNKVRIGSPSDYPGFGVHYHVTEVGTARGVMAQDDTAEHGLSVRYPLDFEKLTIMLTHHMAQFENGSGVLDIDGYKVPMKAASRLYIDAIHTILANHGITADLNLIRAELCDKCKGLGAPAQEFVNNEPVTPNGITHQDS